MKHVCMSGIAVIVLVSVVACEEAGDESVDTTLLGLDSRDLPVDGQRSSLMSTTPETSAADGTKEVYEVNESCDTSEDEVSDNVPASAGELANGERAARMGKQCYATCTVANSGSGTCPDTVSGYGETTFLGGCKKACRKARGDAESKLPPGCMINQCHTSGC